MKGMKLARYLMVFNLTVMVGGVCTAWPQQVDYDSGNNAATVKAPAPKPAGTNAMRPDRTDWLTQSRSDFGAFSKNLFEDQTQIWTSPLKLRLSDAEWLFPAAGITTGFMLTDPSFSKALPSNPSQLNDYNNIRTAGVAAFGGLSGGLYLWSLRTHDPHQRETGLLAGEAMINSLIVTEGVSLITSRERPQEGNGQGRFFQGGSSFPSSHSAAAWAAAGIFAHEYHGFLPQLLAYGLASTVSVTSVTGKQHFPSDVLVGSALGWAISEYVYRTRHNPELGGAAWNPFKELFQEKESGPAKNPGSSYVPVDSWVYRAFDRLAALGYVSAGYEDTRPWSREKCARLLLDVDKSWSGGPLRSSSEVRTLVAALHREFAREEATLMGPNESADVESVYSRIVSANGTVLTDGYHFGQTFAYDYGRPFQEGTNLVSGAAASATYGNLFFYVDGEYQHSPSAPALSLPVREFIAERDKVAVLPATPIATVNRFQLLDTYAGFNFHGWQITFGNQSLSWGPGIGGSLLLSNNADPFPMLRISPENPTFIPGLSKILGPFNVDQFYGRLEGHAGPNQPWIYGQKISFKPFHSLEFAYSRTTLIGGNDHPLTSQQFFDSLVGRVDPAENSVPGDSRTAVDWTWRVPGLRNRVTFYGELEDDDDLIPFQNPSKNVVRPGLYFPRLPLLPKWDLHFEYTSSTSPGRADFQNHGNLNYWNLEYPDGYTNNGDLLANTVGREGVTLQAWIRYWASPRHTLDLSWKQSVVLNDYVPGGGKWQDYQASYSVTRSTGMYFKGMLQFEHIFSYPLLFSGSKNNVVAEIEIGFLPQWRRSTNYASPESSRPTQSLGSQLP